MTDRDLIAEGRAVDAALTPGPWYAVLNDVIGGRAIQTVDKPTSEAETEPPAWVADMIFRDGDAEQIVWIRNNLLALLDALEVAQQAIGVVQTAHEKQLTRMAKERARLQRKVDRLEAAQRPPLGWVVVFDDPRTGPELQYDLEELITDEAAAREAHENLRYNNPSQADAYSLGVVVREVQR